MRVWSLLIVAGLVAAGCTGEASDPPESSTTIASESTTTTEPPTISDACVSGDLAFGEEGLVAAVGEPESDATQLAQVRWERGTSCERLVISFATDSGAPATTLGLTGVSVISFAGVIRVDLPEEVVTTAVADTFTDGLIDHTYVVRDGSDLGVDITVLRKHRLPLGPSSPRRPPIWSSTSSSSTAHPSPWEQACRSPPS